MAGRQHQYPPAMQTMPPEAKKRKHLGHGLFHILPRGCLDTRVPVVSESTRGVLLFLLIVFANAAVAVAVSQTNIEQYALTFGYLAIVDTILAVFFVIRNTFLYTRVRSVLSVMVAQNTSLCIHIFTFSVSYSIRPSDRAASLHGMSCWCCGDSARGALLGLRKSFEHLVLHKLSMM